MRAFPGPSCGAATLFGGCGQGKGLAGTGAGRAGVKPGFPGGWVRLPARARACLSPGVRRIGTSGDIHVTFPILYILSLFDDDLLVAVQGRSNHLWFGDNLEVLQSSIADESVDLVYLDPPFNSSRTHNVIFEKHPIDLEVVAAQIRAFNDTWHWSPATDYLYQRYALAEGLPGPVAAALRALHGLLPEGDTMAYLVHMAPRLAELHRVLKPNGSLYLHCDPAISHYLRLLLDAVFGAANFRNEIIWKCSSAHNSARRYGAVHDVILFYSRSRHYTWNRVPQPLPVETLEQWYSNIEPATGRRFKRDDLTAQGTRTGPSGQPWRGINPTDKGRHWAVPGFTGITDGLPAQQALDALDEAGRIFWPKQADGMPRLKRYLEEAAGIPALDVITDIRPLHNNVGGERIGYPTQKPVALLERFITASSEPGRGGLGPVLRLRDRRSTPPSGWGRNWIGIDIAYVAVDIIVKRLRRELRQCRLLRAERHSARRGRGACPGRPGQVRVPDLGRHPAGRHPDRAEVAGQGRRRRCQLLPGPQGHRPGDHLGQGRGERRAARRP